MPASRTVPGWMTRGRRRCSRRPAPGLLGVAAAGVEVGRRRLRVGAGWTATLAVVGYPAQVGPGWLEPLTAWPGRLDVTVHIEPIPTAVAAARLRRQLARLESTRRATSDRGRLADPAVDTAVADAEDMAAGLARGDGRLFTVGLYLTVHAESAEQLDAEVAAVHAVASSLLLDVVPVTWRALQGWITGLPAGVDLLGMGRTLDTAALAAGFPFLPRETRPAAQPPHRRHRRSRRPRGRVRPTRRRRRRHRHPPRRPRRPDQPARSGRGPPPRRPDPPRPVRAHPPRRPPRHRHRHRDRHRDRLGRAGRAGPGDHHRVRRTRDHRRPADVAASAASARRRRRRPHRRPRPRRCCPGRAARPLRDRIVGWPVRRSDHDTAGRAPGGVVAAGPPR
jgi:hypothetical protein